MTACDSQHGSPRIEMTTRKIKTWKLMKAAV